MVRGRVGGRGASYSTVGSQSRMKSTILWTNRLPESPQHKARFRGALRKSDPSQSHGHCPPKDLQGIKSTVHYRFAPTCCTIPSPAGATDQPGKLKIAPPPPLVLFEQAFAGYKASFPWERSTLPRRRAVNGLPPTTKKNVRPPVRPQNKLNKTATRLVQ